MLHRIERGLDALIDRYSAVCIVLALFVLSLVGVGSVTVVCLLGLTRQSARADLWILLPLLVYDLICLPPPGPRTERLQGAMG